MVLHVFIIVPFPMPFFLNFRKPCFGLKVVIMTKRDSTIADPPSVRDLHVLFEYDIDTPMGLLSGCAAPPPVLPMPTLTENFIHNTPQFHSHSGLQPNECRQRTAHSTTFKIYEYGSRAPELAVEEVDDAGYFKIKNARNLLPRNGGSCTGQAWSACRRLGPIWQFKKLLARVFPRPNHDCYDY